MEPLSDLLGTSQRQVLEFFFIGLKDVSDADVDQEELLYNASVLAHYAQVSTQAGVDMPTPASLTSVFDQFVFDTALNAATNVDTLFEAEWPEDQILLDNDIFTALRSTTATIDGTLGAGYYFEGAGFDGSAAGSAAGIYYNLTTGGLYYNPTAATAGDSILFANVGGATPTLSNVDFTLFTD